MNKSESAVDQSDDLADIIADSDTGGRVLHDRFSINALWYIPLTWSIFQLWIASPSPA